MPTAPIRVALLVAVLAASGCGGGGTPSAAPVPSAPQRPLASLASQRILVVPVSAVAEGDPLGWAASIPRQRDWLRALDHEIANELGQRGLDRAWVFPERLVQGFERNPTLSPDPYRLATEPIRGLRRLTGDERLPDPLASQLRTLVAVHDGRFVLVPLLVSFEAVEGQTGVRPGSDPGLTPAGSASLGRAVLRLALLDARSTEFRWLGEVRTEPSSSLSPAVAASLAARVADLIAAP